MRHRTRPHRRLAILAAALVALSVAGSCARPRSEGGDPALTALHSDPMATWQPAGSQLVDTVSQRQGRTLGKPVPAMLLRVFALDEHAGTDAVLSAAADAAVAAGWQQQVAPTDVVAGRSTQFTRRLGDAQARLTVTVVTNPQRAPSQAGVPALLVELTHQE